MSCRLFRISIGSGVLSTRMVTDEAVMLRLRVFKTEAGKELCRQMFLELRAVTPGV